MANDRQKWRRIDAVFYRGLILWDGFWEAGKGQQTEQRDKAVECFTSAAKEGHPRAQYYLGLAYMYDLGVRRDVHQAVRRFLESAKKDHIDAADARFHLGIAYMHALGVPRDDQKAVDWFRKSADQGHAGAQNNLGIMYSEGWGIEKDKEEAIKWFMRAMKKSEDATVNLGVIYLLNPELKPLELKPHDLLCRYRYSNARARYYYWLTLQEESSERNEWIEKAEELGNMEADYQLLKEKEQQKFDDEGGEIRYTDPHTGLQLSYEDDFGDYYQLLSEIKCHQKKRYSSYYVERVVAELEAEENIYAQEAYENRDALDELQQERKFEAMRLNCIKEQSNDWVSCILDKTSKLDMEETISKRFINAVIKVTDNLHKYELLQDFWQVVNKQYTQEKTRKEEADVIYEYCSALISLLMNNIQEAEKWFVKVEEKIERKVADSESRKDLCQKIIYWRGLMHLQEKSAPGITKQQVLEEARKCFECAARTGLAEAQHEVGMMYRDGIGGEKEPKRAKEWFRRAADQGYPRAACQLGLMYFQQNKISRDFQEAKKWFEEAKTLVPGDYSTHPLTSLSDIIKHKMSPKRSSHYFPAQGNTEIQIKIILHLSFIYLLDSIDKAKQIVDNSDVNRIIPYDAQAYPRSFYEKPMEAMIEGIGIFLEDPKDDNCMQFLEAPIYRKDASGKDERSILEWLLAVAEWAGNSDMRDKVRKLLAKYVGFPGHFITKKDINPHRSRLLIKWILIAAEAGDREKREIARKLLVEHNCSVERLVWYHIWKQKYSDSARNLAWRDLLRALADSHDSKESREDSTAMYSYYYALSSLFLDVAEATKYFDLALENLQNHGSRKSIDVHWKKEQDIRRKILYWLGCIYHRDDIQETSPQITKQQALVKARKYLEEAARSERVKLSANCEQSNSKEDKYVTIPGLAEAQYEIGVMYRDGIGEKKKPKEARKWFEQAAEQGNPRAAYQLGLMYFHGQDGISQDIYQAKMRFRKSFLEYHKVQSLEDLEHKCRHGEIWELELAELGHIYRERAWDYLEWHPMIYRDACWREQADALAHLGYIDLLKDLKGDTREAREHFEKAAQACHAGAMINLGFMFLKNNDRSGAIEWFERAWEGDLECDECGPEGRFNGAKEVHENVSADEVWSKAASDLQHHAIANRKLKEKYYLCSDEHSLKLRRDGDWWPRYRGNWLALHHLEILYRSLGEKEKAKRCRERLEMTGFTMPDYSKRI